MLAVQTKLFMYLTMLTLVECHIADRTHLTELKKLCEYAYSCFHDTVPVCGKSVNEARTFLDICDLYEFSCEHNMVFRHVKEEDGVCPNPKELGLGIG